MNNFKEIDKAIEFVTSRRNNTSLEIFKCCLEKLGNIQNDLKVIHIAGTNGKGSTVNFIKDILLESGYKVGTFTSPHLIKHQDRIRINDNYIDDDKFLYYLNLYLDIITKNNLNMFQIDTLIMCKYFCDEKVDYAIIETGIGGRLDSTNIFNSNILSIITSIGYDHMDKLGNNLKDIANEKSYIIKDEVLLSYIDDDLKYIFKEKNNNVYETKPYKKINSKEFIYKENKYEICNKAEYQMKNACCAIEAINIIEPNINYETIKYAINKSLWKGRFEQISFNPDIVIDGAHNKQGINEFLKSIDYYKKPHNLVFTALKDKQVYEMIDLLKSHFNKLIITEFEFYRSIKIDEFKKEEGIYYIKDYNEAIKFAENEGTLFICGSLYFISEVRSKYIKE